MSLKNTSSRQVRIWGYAILAVGLLSSAADFADRYVFHAHQLNMGIVIGDSALIFLGLVTTIVANCLRTIERKIEALERR